MKEKLKKYKFDILAILILLTLAIIKIIVFIQNDTFYSLAIGKDILKYGIDMKDHYSIHNLSYDYPHWLFDSMIYQAYKYLGYFGIYLFNCLFGFLISLSTYLFLSKKYKDKLFSMFFAASFLLFNGSNITGRAQTISYLVFFLEIICIEKFLDSGRKKYLVFLYLLLMLLFNTHMAMYPVYYAIFLPYIVEYIISIFKEKHEKIFNLKQFNFDKFIIEKNDNIKKLIIFILISITAGFITPIGYKAFLYIFQNKSGDVISYIMEHQPTVLVTQTNFCIALVIMISLFVLLNIKIRLRDFFMFCGFLLMSFARCRNISLFYIIFALLFGRIIIEYINKYDKYGSNKIINIITKNIIYIPIIFVLSFYSYYKISSIKKEDYLMSNFNLYPEKAANYLLKNVDYKNMRLYNDYNEGSYLAFRGIKVFIDSRADLYEQNYNHFKRSIIKDCMELSVSNYKEIFNYYKITHVLYEKNTNIAKTLKKDNLYETIYQDNKYIIFKRKSN